MKAIRIHERGGPEQLIYEDAPKPVPGRGDAVVRVLAAGVTPTQLSWPSAPTTPEAVLALQCHLVQGTCFGRSL
jgi:NADPH:quinone reductase-like Zn-dependent oxidoreductase